MKKKENSKLKSFTYREFEKEFLTSDKERKKTNKGALYELGRKMARESLSASIQ